MPLVFFGAVAIATVAESMRGVVCVAALVFAMVTISSAPVVGVQIKLNVI